jgi:hypothetical protein
MSSSNHRERLHVQYHRKQSYEVGSSLWHREDHLSMTSVGKDSLKTQRTLAVGNRNYEYFSLPVAEQKLGDISRLPISLKILLENILRLEDGRAYTVEHAQAIAGWPKKRTSTQEVAFSCGRSHPFG